MTELLEKVLEPILLKENLKDYNVKISGGSERGDGYIGEIIFAEVVGKTVQKEEKVYNFVVKCAKESEEFRQQMPVKECFINEINFYNEIVPTFRKFQEEKKVTDAFDDIAKCYGFDLSGNREFLVFENLKVKGYELHDRKKAMNEEHIKKILERYGKFHAISFALRDQKPKTFLELCGKLTDMFKLFAEQNKPGKNPEMYQQIVELAEKENEPEIIEVCKKLMENEENFKLNAIDSSDPYNVILHGDCWNNNFLFKYEKDKKSPSKICFLDFQASRLASPVYDLTHFLFTTLSEDTVLQFNEFVDHYYNSLSTAIRNLGSDPNTVFPFEKLLEHLNKYAFWGLIVMPGMIKVCLSEGDEVLDFVEAAEKGIDFKDMLAFKVKNEDEYRKRTLPVLKLAIKKGFLDHY